MNIKSKALKQRLRGISLLKTALEKLRWAAWTPPGEEEIAGYVVGPGPFVAYVSELVVADMAKEEDYAVADAPAEELNEAIMSRDSSDEVSKVSGKKE